MSETCKHPDSSFDRTLCAEPCGAMHNYCTECGECVDPCPHKATPSSGVTEGKAESGERISGRDYCPLDGEPLWLRIQSGGKPQLYIHADRLTWHTDVTDKIRTAAWEYPFTAEAPGSPEAMLREIFAAQPPAPADDAAEVLAGLLAGFEHERWWSADDEVKFEIWTKAMRRVEAAQQRLADRGQSGGEG